MRLGLRAKSALVLSVCIAFVLALTGVIGWRTFRVVEETRGTAFARNLTQYNKQRLLTPILRELALSQRFADSEVTRRWLLDENDPAKKALFFAEAERYRRAFSNHSYFVGSSTSHNYYFNDSKSALSREPRYVLRPDDPKESWFFATLKQKSSYNLNVDFNPKINVTNVWFNIVIKDGAQPIGIAGSGVELTEFLNQFIITREKGVTPMLLNKTGAIQAHPDRALIDYSSISHSRQSSSTIYRLLDAPGKEVVRQSMRKATENPEEIQTFRVNMDGTSKLLAIAYIPELSWYVVNVIDLQAARVMDRLWLPFLLGGLALLGLFLCAITVALNRLILSPLLSLTNAVRAMAGGNYEAELPRASNDEIGELTRAFGSMASQVRSYTEELESKVEERTRELADANEQMREASKQISDSIQYASLIQSAILPDGEMQRTLADAHFVLWRPRDVVGGDFYVFRGDEKGCLLGVVDCAGHGVAGAFMTMIAHSALEVATDAIGLDNPAALLKTMDGRIRSALQTKPEYSSVATHMDAGLAYIDFQNSTVTFAGAKVSLYWCDGAGANTAVGELKGDRYTLGGKHVTEFHSKSVALESVSAENDAAGSTPAVRTFYLTTDGFLDQAGGKRGFSLGVARFAELMKRYAHLPLERQRDAFAAELEEYQGELAQRDDITLLGFRFGSR